MQTLIRTATILGLVLAAASMCLAEDHAPHAKSVIQIWVWGGPSQLETFDPKPQSGYDITGPLNKAIDTNVPGIQIGELLPRLAKMADQYAIIRSMTHGINAHETAAYLMQTGHAPQPGVLFPSLGALVARYRGYQAGYQGVIPPYVVLTESQGRFSEEGYLGIAYKPFVTGGDPSAAVFAVDGIILPDVSNERQQQRRGLLSALDTMGRHSQSNDWLESKRRADDDAYTVILGETREVFNLNAEDNTTRDLYGRHWIGQACLMARRLVEQGVPYITINYKGWDTHKQHFETMRRRLPEMDQALAALLTDLKARNLLDTTIVWWGGEFGRTPRVDWQPPWNGGRGHYGACFSVLLAGGGFRGGVVVGRSDETAARVLERPVYPADLLGSILTRMGIDPDAQVPNERGLQLPAMPVDPRGTGRLTEIMPDHTP